MLSYRATKVAAVLITHCGFGLPAYGQSGTAPAEQVKTEIYFGSELRSGATVSKRDWERFISDAIIKRFPTGLTVIDAAGKGRDTPGGLKDVRILVLVHPRSADFDARLDDVKLEYKKRFASAGLFQIDQAVQVRP
jgi:hypothetical protein